MMDQRVERRSLPDEIRAALTTPDARQWLADAGVLVGCLVLVGALFWQETAGAVTVWIQSPTFNHCFLILPITLYMMWHRREGLARTAHVPFLPAAGLILPVSAAWFVARELSILELRQFAVVGMLQAFLLTVFGWKVYRRLAAAFLYLIFLVPAGAELVPSLQQVTAHLAVFGLHEIGTPVYSNGAVIETPTGTFAVAEACAGLRFLVATVAFGVFYAAEIFTGPIRRLAFVGLCIAVPIVANALRVLGIIVAAEWLGNAKAALADHLIYGWVFFSFVLVILIAIGNLFSDVKSVAAPLARDADTEPAARALPARKMVRAVLVCLSGALVFPAAAWLIDVNASPSVPASAPVVAAPWRRVADDGLWKPILAGPARSYFGRYSDGKSTLYSLVALYPAHGNGNNLVRSTNRVADERQWHLNSSRSIVLHVGRDSIPATQTELSGGDKDLAVWSFYVVDGTPLSSVWQVKLRQLQGLLSGRSCTSAFVAIAAEEASNRPPLDATEAYLQSMVRLRPYLCK